MRTIAITILLVAAWLGVAAQQSTYVPTEENLRARHDFKDNKL